MVWLYVPGSAASNSECDLHSDAVIASSATLRGTPMRPRSWRRAWRTAPWIRRLSGMTLSPSMAAAGVERWISSLRDSPAPPSPSPDYDVGPTTSDGSGMTSRESSARSSQRGSTSRTCPGSSAPTDVFAILSGSRWTTPQMDLYAIGRSPTYSGAWPSSGTMRSGRCSARPKWAPLTSGSGGSASPGMSYERGLYPTPSATPYGSSQNGSNGEGGENERPSAGTPSLESWAKRWPTPTSMDGCREGQPRAEAKGAHAVSLHHAVASWPPDDRLSAQRGHGDRDPTVSRFLPGTPGSSLVPTLWPTPRASENENRTTHHSPSHADGSHGKTLAGGASLWLTPTTSDVRGEREPDGKRSGDRSDEAGLDRMATSWPTPNTRDAASAGRHTTETGVMHPGTTLTDAMRQWDAASAGRHTTETGVMHPGTIARNARPLNEQACHCGLPAPETPPGGESTSPPILRSEE